MNKAIPFSISVGVAIGICAFITTCQPKNGGLGIKTPSEMQAEQDSLAKLMQDSVKQAQDSTVIPDTGIQIIRTETTP